nr:hypothetical protein [Alicyclobacillus herbarius]
MYKVHQGANLVQTDIASPAYAMEGQQIDQVSVSASGDEEHLNVSLCNLHHAESVGIVCDVRGRTFKEVSGTVLTASQMQAHTWKARSSRPRMGPWSTRHPICTQAGLCSWRRTVRLPRSDEEIQS